MTNILGFVHLTLDLEVHQISLPPDLRGGARVLASPVGETFWWGKNIDLLETGEKLARSALGDVVAKRSGEIFPRILGNTYEY